MGDPENNSAEAVIPAWQQSSPADSESKKQTEQDTEDPLQVARRFLDEEEVKAAPHEKKVKFLQSKGVAEDDIQKLLGGNDAGERDAVVNTTNTEANGAVAQTPSEKSTASPTASHDRAPVVTYPEFLAKPQRPPPLVTTNGLLGTLYGFVGLSTLLYGTSKYLVGPMVDSLTDARLDLHDTTHKKLDLLVAELEKNVSVVPDLRKDIPKYDELRDDEDPTEMFHRDIGTQTSFPLTPSGVDAKKHLEPESIRQADRLQTLTKSLSGLKDQLRTQSEGMEDIKAVLDVFRDDLDSMTYGGQSDFVGGYDLYGKSKKNEPEDEIRKVRDNIRRVKGVLLSTRNFPSSTR